MENNTMPAVTADKSITLKTQPKWKSKIFWTAIASVVLMILGNFGLYDKIGITSEFAQGIINTIFAAAAALGVWNDSSDAINY